jgi:hypothetical protein
MLGADFSEKQAEKVIRRRQGFGAMRWREREKNRQFP